MSVMAKIVEVMLKGKRVVAVSMGENKRLVVQFDDGCKLSFTEWSVDTK